MTTQLATNIKPVAPLRSKPFELCPDRDKCLRRTNITSLEYRCGFEQAGTVNKCPKRSAYHANLDT